MCCRTAHEPQGRVPGQCAHGKLLCIPEKGAGSPSAAQNTRAGQGCNPRIYRSLLQPAETPFRDRIPNPATGLQQYDLENGRIGSIIKLSGYRHEVQCHKSKPSNHHDGVSPHCIQTSWSQQYFCSGILSRRSTLYLCDIYSVLSGTKDTNIRCNTIHAKTPVYSPFLGMLFELPRPRF